MAGFLPDTSCMVAAVCTWHEHHAPAAAEINRRLAQREPMVVAAPALVESYAVLTRLPPPHRLSAADALALLDANFMRPGTAVALDAAAYRTLLRRMVAQGIVGGRTYDAVIARCALRAKASCLLTFNAPHFLAFAAGGLEVVVPKLAPAPS
jgi:predicted nucleic acid-binding protein